jgi:hypothetical protein
LSFSQFSASAEVKLEIRQERSTSMLRPCLNPNDHDCKYYGLKVINRGDTPVTVLKATFQQETRKCTVKVDKTLTAGHLGAVRVHAMANSCLLPTLGRPPKKVGSFPNLERARV